MLFENIESMGGNAIMWRTGHSLIKTKMAETNALLAGEMSGHIFFKDRYFGFDDAIYAAVRLVEIMGNKKQSLAQLKDKMPSKVNTPEIRFQCDDSKKFDIVNEVKERLIANGTKINAIDGVRVKTDEGWWLLRASNTQDVLVARCEASNEENLDSLKNHVINELELTGICVNF